MTNAAPEPVEVRRRGRRIWVADAPQGARGVAWHDGGRTELERTARGLEASVPSGSLVGVVVRHGEVVRVGAAPGSRERGVRVMLADLSVDAGGAAREVAFLVVTNDGGRLSSSLPLHEASERGQLSSLRWLAEGIAAVGLSAPLRGETVDLTVRMNDALVRELEVPVAHSWPQRAVIDAPRAAIAGDAFPVRGEVTTADGTTLSGEDVVLRCGGTPVTGGECVAPEVPGELPLTLAARVDGEWIPVAHSTLEVEPSPPPPPPPPPPEPRGFVAATLRGDLAFAGPDLALAGGFRAGRYVHPLAAVTLALDYAWTPLAAEGSVQTPSALRGSRHRVRALVGVDLGRGRPLGWLVRVAGGAGVAQAAASLDAVDASGTSVALVGMAGAGLRLRLDVLDLGVVAGFVVESDRHPAAWDRPGIGGGPFLELSGALRF